jgi:Fungal specific transcription factor domain
MPSSSTPELRTSTSSSSPTEQSPTATPAGGAVTVSNYRCVCEAASILNILSLTSFRYFHPEQHAGPSFISEFNVFPHNTAHAQDTDVTANSYYQLPLFDPNRPRFPHPHRMRKLGAIFFDHVGVHFPFLDRFDVLHRIEQRTCSAILSNCIAGLATRFANPSQPDLAAGLPFYDMAKTLAANVISMPSVEALHALICITWAEYGAGRDDGFWTYSRMAITMCLDLGLGNEATIQVAATPEVRHRLRLTWWMVVCTADIAASWATGRPATLDLDQHDTSLPEPTDDLSLLFRNIFDLVVLRRKLDRVLGAHVDNQGDNSLDWDLSELQTALMNMSKDLPSTMVFNKHNLLRMRDRHAGHLFVHMHILIHAVSALVHRPSLILAYGLPVPTEGPRVEAARTCAESLADILMTVESVAPQTLRDPFMDLPIQVACRIFVAEGDAQFASLAAPGSPDASLLLDACKGTLVRLSAAWGGAVTFDNLLERHGWSHGGDFQLPLSSCKWPFTSFHSRGKFNHILSQPSIYLLPPLTAVTNGSSILPSSTMEQATALGPFVPPPVNSLPG